MDNRGQSSETVADAGADQVAVSFVSGLRFVVAAEAGDSPGLLAWHVVLLGVGVQPSLLHGNLAPIIVDLYLVWAASKWYRKLRTSGRLAATPVTVAFDAEGVTYSSPDGPVTVAWPLWRRAYRRLGVWHVKLDAAPLKGIAFPDAALDSGQRDEVRRVLAEHGLLRGSRR